jgi:hypothetical protein
MKAPRRVSKISYVVSKANNYTYRKDVAKKSDNKFRRNIFKTVK